MIRSRQLVTAALATLFAGAAVVAIRARTPRSAVLDAASLPWGAVHVDGVSLVPASVPAAVLYVLPSCRYCDSAVALFATETRRAAIDGLVISASGSSEAEQYRSRLLLPKIATDSAQTFARAAGIRVVPSLGRLMPDGQFAISPIPRPGLVAIQLRTPPARRKR